MTVLEEPLTTVELRVLSALIEKQITTPEYYPLSMNALINACNQKSNRDPVVNYEELIVGTAIDQLRRTGLARKVSDDTARVPKYIHTFANKIDANARETALLCELMLRGPQTSGELRARAKRLHDFGSIEEVEGILEALADRERPLAARLARQRGSRERRWAHLLGDEPLPIGEDVEEAQESAASRPQSVVEELHAEIDGLRNEIKYLRDEFLQFKKQFD